MGTTSGRRERKKAATRQNIADTAARLFLEHGFDAVGIREVAAAADVAVTTVFAHFASKEALVFAQDDAFRERLEAAVVERGPDDALTAVLRREIRALVAACTTPRAAPVWRMVDETPSLREHEEMMRLRHAESLAEAIARDLGLDEVTTPCRTLARFTVDAFALARETDDPEAAVDEIFTMIDAAWAATGLDTGRE